MNISFVDFICKFSAIILHIKLKCHFDSFSCSVWLAFSFAHFASTPQRREGTLERVQIQCAHVSMLCVELVLQDDDEGKENRKQQEERMETLWNWNDRLHRISLQISIPTLLFVAIVSRKTSHVTLSSVFCESQPSWLEVFQVDITRVWGSSQQ